MRAHVFVLMAVINYIIGIKRSADYSFVLFPSPSVSPKLTLVLVGNQFLKDLADIGKSRMRHRLSAHNSDGARKSVREIRRNRRSQRQNGFPDGFQIHLEDLLVVPDVPSAVGALKIAAVRDFNVNLGYSINWDHNSPPLS